MDTPPRIACVALQPDAPLFGSAPAAARLRDLVRALRARGAAVVVLTAGTGDAPPADLRDLDVEVVTPTAGAVTGAVADALARLGPFEAVHQRGPAGRDAALAFARRTGAASILEISTEGEVPAGDLREAVAVLAASADVAAWCARAGVPRDRILVLPAAATTPSVARRAADPGAAFVSVVVGRLRADRGVETLVEAVALLTSMGADHRATIAGGGPERASLQRYVAALGIDDRVTFLPRGGRAALAAADAAVAPFLPAPGAFLSSMRLYQYMAAGLPIVASRVPGVEALLDDGTSGMLVPPGDPQALALRLERLRRDPDLARSLGEAARRRAERDGSWDRLATGILAAAGTRPTGRHRR